MRRRHFAALATIVAVLPAAPASGATFGSDFTGAPEDPPSASCGPVDACTVVRDDAGAPVAGVVTRWRVRAAASATGATARLRIVRPEAGGHRLVAESADATLAGGVQTVEAGLPLRAGDLLALRLSGDPLPAVLGAPGTGADVLIAGDAGFGVGDTRGDGTRDTRELLLSADVEPDADADGLGDDTQDPCPSHADRTACRADVSLSVEGPSTGVTGEALQHLVTVRNAGPDAAPRTVATLAMPAGSPVPAGCTAGAPVRCAIGTLAPGATAVIRVALDTTRTGTRRTEASLATSAEDPAPGDAAGAAETLVTPPSVAPAPVELPAPACANALFGTRDDDVVRGTAFGDRLVGRDGRDLLRGVEGPDCLEGGSGGDVLDGGTDDDRLSGGLGRDRLIGGPGADRLRGGLHHDRLLGNEGDDTLEPGRGRDRVHGGSGNDIVLARDGARDVVDCGPGYDTVRADRRDRLRRCERRTGPRR